MYYIRIIPDFVKCEQKPSSGKDFGANFIEPPSSYNAKAPLWFS